MERNGRPTTGPSSVSTVPLQPNPTSLGGTISQPAATATMTTTNEIPATPVKTNSQPTTTEPMPPFPSERKPAAAIIGGTIGGISAVICITTITIHKIRNRRRNRRALARLAEIQERNFDSGYEVNGITGTGTGEGNQSIWSRGPVVSFILDGRRRDTVMTTGSRL
ncbi:hypothetical protein TWF718_001126 [Orbilia javanica]|uniref:Uncharacterized protein n=1 Tax=Orbilia javanica TaxID=47235 RepID=A0AAN8P288_9PEZI